ncbi:FitA-like ribbon-helix-helix domain-containing protein [Stenoxybacter acetivorans]|uniref:FitA-like ribbon-helix-helix domain-containing protein n=1 Tax=Stenoxybacter acetivorans TaxID=422441 RepID=UPI00056906BE|nr:hypothetical protein [Stenoxybacter acetivorans]
MAMLTVRNLPDEVHRALKIKAAHNGRSTEAEVREILAAAVKPQGRILMGTAIIEAVRNSGAKGLSDEEHASFTELRNKTTTEPIRFED